MANYYTPDITASEEQGDYFTPDIATSEEQDNYYTTAAAPAEYQNDQPYSVARYETTSGPWHNILDVPGTESWQGDPVYAVENSPNGSAAAIHGSDENVAQHHTPEKKLKDKNKKEKKSAGHKKEGKDGPKKDKTDKHDKSGGHGADKGHHGHETHARSAH